MNYHIKRGDQNYGPYTLADLQRYVASGHVLPNDLAKSEEMTEWMPVSQVLNPAGLPPAFDPAAGFGAPPVMAYQAGYEGGYAPVPAGAPVMQYDDPPNLSWGLVLLFDFLTCGVFQLVWNFILSAWMKRVQPASQAIIYYAAGYGLQLINTGLSIPIFLGVMHHQVSSSHHYGLNAISLVAWVIRIVARFNMKSSLEEHYNTVEPIGLRLNGVMVFFFGGLYLQSQMNRVNEIKKAMRYRSGYAG